MQHLESCLPGQLKLTELCQVVMFLTVFFHWMHKMKFSCFHRPVAGGGAGGGLEPPQKFSDLN